MKKLLKALLFLLLLSPLSAQALSPECPRDFSEELALIQDCQGPTYQNALTNLFTGEREQFVAVLNQVHQDSFYHPQNLSRKIVQELRVSRQCLDTICRELVNSCQNQDASKYGEFERYNDCSQKANTFFQVQALESVVAVNQNAARKQRSTVREKFRQLEGKMRQYFVPLFIGLVNELTNFDGKFTNFTPSPS